MTPSPLARRSLFALAALVAGALLAAPIRAQNPPPVGFPVFAVTGSVVELFYDDPFDAGAELHVAQVENGIATEMWDSANHTLWIWDAASGMYLRWGAEWQALHFTWIDIDVYEFQHLEYRGFPTFGWVAPMLPA